MAVNALISTVPLAVFIAVCISSLLAQQPVKIPKTQFSCEGRPSGYYADLETGCQVYHMCDGLGRQFSYSCPNTTLFQQRMLICDHWYMVNCSASERDYSANLLIGQRNKPFVSDSEDHQRTPRPDILSVPYAQGFNNYGGTLEKAHITTGSGNNLVENPITNGSNDLNDGVHHFAVPTHWSTELSNANRFTTPTPVVNNGVFTGRPIIITSPEDNNGLVQQSTEHNVVLTSPPQNFKHNHKIQPLKEHKDLIESSTRTQEVTQNQRIDLFNHNFAFTNPPSKLIDPPKLEPDFTIPAPNENIFKKPSSTTVKSIASFNNELLGDLSKLVSVEETSSEQAQTDSVITFINRFNPDDPPNIFQETQTRASIYSTTKANKFLNSGKKLEIQSSSETAGFITQSNNRQSNEEKKTTTPSAKPTASKVFVPTGFNKEKNLNTLFPQQSLERNTSEKEINQNEVDKTNEVVKPALDLLPPKKEYSDVASTTMGPPIYYEWKWAAPSLDLEPPKLKSDIKLDNVTKTTKNEGKPDFALPKSTTEKSAVQITQRSISDQSTSEGNIDYKVAPYFIPDYVFPLDKQHPGYEEDGAMTSFQVRIPHSIDNNDNHPYYGENEQCPQCHPSFVIPGTCKPCVMIRR